MNLNNINVKSVGILNADFGLLFLRIVLWGGLFAKHGAEKIFTFNEMKENFPDPIGIGATAGLIFALVTDAICSWLILVGFFTRFASLLIALNLFVVFALMHGFSIAEGHAELVFVYFGGFLALFLAGPGKYSLDAKLSSRNGVQ